MPTDDTTDDATLARYSRAPLSRAQVLEILYKTDEAEEFISPDEAAAAVPLG